MQADKFCLIKIDNFYDFFCLDVYISLDVILGCLSLSLSVRPLCESDGCVL